MVGCNVRLPIKVNTRPRRAVPVDITVNCCYNSRMKSVRLRAFAKANVSLNVTGKSDGLHTLDSVMTTVDLCDTVTVTERADSKIIVRFENADIDCFDNTAYKAARLVMEAINCHGCDITIEKGIPIGGGLGGSSADGAAVLRALDLFYRIPNFGVDMRAIALKVGSDVPFMLTGGSARVTGKGEELFFFENKLPMFAVALMDEAVSTAKAYALLDEQHGGKLCPADNDKLVDLLMSGDNKALSMFSNALTESAKTLAPSVADNIKLLKNSGAVPCLTGSGGTVLGWFTEIEKFAECAGRLGGRKGFRVLSTARTGILHEWISRNS